MLQAGYKSSHGGDRMTISDVIKELQKRKELYGDMEVIFRAPYDDGDADITSVYVDEDVDRVVVSSDY